MYTKLRYVIGFWMAFCCMVIHVDAITLVQDGQAKTAIVMPDNALPIVKFAAEELQHHILKATGVKLEIYPESKNPDNFKGLVYVGKCKAAAKVGLIGKKLLDNAYVIKLVGDDLFLYGNDYNPYIKNEDFGALERVARIGSISAVYEFLDKKLGVRWLWPGELGEYVPECKNIVVDKWDQEYRPEFIETQLGLGPLRYGKDFWGSKSAANAYEHATKLWVRRHRFCLTKNISGCHAFFQYWKRFGKTHPEFFSLLPDGKRKPFNGDFTGHFVTMCVSQPALRKQLICDWMEHKQPPWSWQGVNGYNYLPCGDNDSPGMCMCKNCRALDAPDPRFKTSLYWTGKIMPGFNLAGRGIYPEDEQQNEPSLSDRYAKFYLSVYNDAVKINPNVMVTASAYVNYASPPKQTKLNDRICISIVPPGIYPQTENTGKSFREQWQGWRDTGAVLKLRPNITHAGHNMPVSYARWLQRNFAFAAERGMVATAWDSLLGEYAIQGPTLYMLARMHVRPDMSCDAILDEYYTAFGPAKEVVKEYFDYWEVISKNVTEEEFKRYSKEEQGGDHRNWLRVADRIFTPSVMRRGRELMNKVKAVPGLDKVEKARVKFIDDGLTHAEMTLKALRAYKEFKKSGKSSDRLAAGNAMNALFAFRKEKEPSGISNMGYLAYREKATWNLDLIQTAKNLSPFVSRWYVSEKLPKSGSISSAKCVSLGDDLNWQVVNSSDGFASIHNLFGNADGMVYFAQRFKVDEDGVWIIKLGHDGGIKLFIDGKDILCESKLKNPAKPDRSEVGLTLEKGIHELVVAFDLARGNGWGIFSRFLNTSKKGNVVFPVVMKHPLKLSPAEQAELATTLSRAGKRLAELNSALEQIKNNKLKNLIPYPSFERISCLKASTFGVWPPSVRANVVLDGTVACSGSKSVKFTNVPSGSLNRFFPVKAGEKYLVGLDCYNPGDGICCISIGWRAQGKFMNDKLNKTFMPAGNGKWKKILGIVTVPPDTDELVYCVSVSGQGKKDTCYVDNLMLYKLQ